MDYYCNDCNREFDKLACKEFDIFICPYCESEDWEENEEYLKEILEKLELNEMHVHAISGDERLPFFITNSDTHFIMKGDKVVFKGNIAMLENFVLGLK